MQRRFLMSTTYFKRGAMIAATGAMLFVSGVSVAQQQESVPELPDPLKTLASSGAQMRYLGKESGLDGWVAIKNGQEQYFYVLPDGQGFLSGVLFDKDGKVITVNQVARLRKDGKDTDVLDTLASDTPIDRAEAENKAKKYEFMTPSEQLFFDVENSNWLPLGQAGTPVFYALIDPQCPHCHDMMASLKDKIDSGKVQVRIIPVGRTEQSKAQAAFLMAAPDPAGTWWRHMNGDADALPAKQGINIQGVERNMLLMQTWKFQGTPTVVYRAKDGTVKIITSKPKDIDALINDLGSKV